jgi:CubicO group peptidase (beta-lactamase class C family)
MLSIVLMVVAAAPQGPPCHSLAGIVGIQQELLAQAPLFASSCVRIEQQGAVAHQSCVGTYAPVDVVPIASATKTLSAAVLMSLVDSGLLSLDDTVGQYLPEWNTGQKALITLRMCFAHTSGMNATHPAVGDDTLTLRQAAAQIATAPLSATPGTQFVYGGVSMHVAGAVCEVAAGQSWTQLFQQRIAAPLGMTATDYLAFGTTLNPRIAGGARSNVPDFARFVEMLRRSGVHQGVQVLSAASVDAMLSDQTAGATIVATPHPEQAPYGVGIWLDRRDANGNTLVASGVGAFGFTGWVDRAHDASGVFLIRYSNQQSWPFVQRIWGLVDAAMLPPGVACIGVGSPACRADAWLNATSRPTAGDSGFAVIATRAPVGALGAIALGDPLPSGAAIGDLVAFVGPNFVLGATIVADAHGNARLAAPLAAGLVGQTFGLQAVWLDAAPCTALGLSASHAITFTVAP